MNQIVINKNSNHFLKFILRNTEIKSLDLKFLDRSGKYTTLSYSDLWRDIQSYAHTLQSLGVKEDDVVSIMLPTCSEFLASFFAVQLLKAIPVSLYPPTSLSDLSSWNNSSVSLMNSVDSKHLVTNKRINSLCTSIFKSNKIQITLTESLNLEFNSFEFKAEKFNEEDYCFLQFSSGTTGKPKAIVIKQKNALINSLLIRDALPVQNEKISVACWLPLYHDMGLVGCLLMSIFNGTNLVLIRPDDFITKPQLWLQAMHDHKINCTTAPNFAYGLVHKRVPEKVIEQYDLSHVKAMLCGAEMVYLETMNKFTKHMLPARLDPKAVLPVYGMAEATLAVSFTEKEIGLSFIKVNKSALQNGRVSLDANGLEICSVGKLLPSFNIQIVDSENIALENNCVGRILLKGPSLTSGYYKNLNESSKLYIRDWLDTGDEGFIFEGQLYICGRFKDTMVIRGRNYYPTMFEENLYQINGIRKGRALVSSAYNPANNSEEIVVLAEVDQKKVLKTESSRIKKEIHKILSHEALPIFAIELYPPGHLLKTSSGKIKRKENINRWKNKKSSNNKYLPKLHTLIERNYYTIKFLSQNIIEKVFTIKKSSEVQRERHP